MCKDWQQKFFDLADHISQWSKDPSTKVGCVLVDSKFRVIGLGYNGFPRYVNDIRSRLEDREQKLLYTQHAEANALLNAVANTEGSRAYVTHHPCAHCAGLLIQAGVCYVTARHPSNDLAERFKDSFAVTKIMFKEANVGFNLE